MNNQTFCVIRYKIESLIPGMGVCWQWAKVHEKNGKAQYQDIERSDAMRLIKDNGLTLKHRDADGSVYDDGTFYEKYKHGKLKV